MSIRAFYNEIDLYCCAWLSNLMDAGLITPGVICDKSIEDVLPDELFGFDRVHMFAGIGVWDFALNSAGWGSAKVWTGSCPCQPFSKAGEGLGFADERHLWPAWHHLIKQRKPPEILGEQVPDSIKKGWLDLVCDDLEASEYAVGAIRFGADATGQAIERQRIYFAAKHISQGVEGSKPGSDLGQARSRRWRGQEDLLAIAGSPFVQGDSWPQPLLRSVADGASSNMGPLHAIGNAINVEAATQFIAAYLET